MFPQIGDNGANVFETQTFIGGGTPGAQAATSPAYVWHKPMGCRFVSFFLVGAGGGGGGGFTRAAAAAGGGGGGGGSGGMVRALFLADTLPDILYLHVPAGGTGASGSGVAGSAGGRVFVNMVPGQFTNESFLIGTGNADAGGGGAGTGAAAGALGAASTVATANAGMFLCNAISWQAVAGNAGTAGGAQTGAAGGNVSSPALTVTGGAGGGGTTSADFSGGRISAGLLVPAVNEGTAASPAGNAGIFLPKPWMARGGSGGAALNNAAGGRGGDGHYGCGGGGGGAGTTGGGGGNGGPGVCIITAF